MREDDKGRCLSQDEIAKRLGVSRARVSRIERNALQKLRMLASELGWNLEDLFDMGSK